MALFFGVRKIVEFPTLIGFQCPPSHGNPAFWLCAEGNLGMLPERQVAPGHSKHIPPPGSPGLEERLVVATAYSALPEALCIDQHFVAYILGYVKI